MRGETHPRVKNGGSVGGWGGVPSGERGLQVESVLEKQIDHDISRCLRKGCNQTIPDHKCPLLAVVMG